MHRSILITIFIGLSLTVCFLDAEEATATTQATASPTAASGNGTATNDTVTSAAPAAATNDSTVTPGHSTAPTSNTPAPTAATSTSAPTSPHTSSHTSSHTAASGNGTATNDTVTSAAPASATNDSTVTPGTTTPQATEVPCLIDEKEECQNGGFCYKKAVNGKPVAVCDCADGYQGKLCKEQTPSGGSGGFDTASFFGGMILIIGVAAIGCFGYKYYKSRQTANRYSNF